MKIRLLVRSLLLAGGIVIASLVAFYASEGGPNSKGTFVLGAVLNDIGSEG